MKGKEMKKEEIEQAYADYELDYYKKQAEVCGNLLQIHNNEEIPSLYRKWIIDAVNFIIKEKKWVPFVNASAN